CLVGGVTGRLAMEIKTDQQVRAEAYAFPAYEQHGVVIGQDQCQHGEHEEIQIAEEAVIAAFMRHVTGGVDVDEHADASDKEEPDAGERVEQDSNLRIE